MRIACVLSVLVVLSLCTAVLGSAVSSGDHAQLGHAGSLRVRLSQRGLSSSLLSVQAESRTAGTTAPHQSAPLRRTKRASGGLEPRPKPAPKRTPRPRVSAKQRKALHEQLKKAPRKVAPKKAKSASKYAWHKPKEAKKAPKAQAVRKNPISARQRESARRKGVANRRKSVAKRQAIVKHKAKQQRKAARNKAAKSRAARKAKRTKSKKGGAKKRGANKRSTKKGAKARKIKSKGKAKARRSKGKAKSRKSKGKGKGKARKGRAKGSKKSRKSKSNNGKGKRASRSKKGKQAKSRKGKNAKGRKSAKGKGKSARGKRLVGKQAKKGEKRSKAAKKGKRTKATKKGKRAKAAKKGKRAAGGAKKGKKAAGKRGGKKSTKRKTVDTSGSHSDMLNRRLARDLPNSKKGKEKKSPLRPGVYCPISFLEIDQIPLTDAEKAHCAQQRAQYMANKAAGGASGGSADASADPTKQADEAKYNAGKAADNAATPGAQDPEFGKSPDSLPDIKGKHTMTVAELPLDAKVDMTLNDVSYRVKREQADALKSGVSSKQLWTNELQNEANQFKGTELHDPLASMKVEKSSFDQAVITSTDAKTGRSTIYAGGHGSASAADWVGQNAQLSRVPGVLKEAADAVGLSKVANAIPDIEMRGQRLTQDTDAVLTQPQYAGKVDKINVFGHSMAGMQGHLAANALTKEHPDIKTEAYLLNPGGVGTLPPASNVHHVVTPGEVLSRVGLGGGDPNQINLRNKNIDPQQAKGISGTVYLHSNDRVMDDIREFEGVKDPNAVQPSAGQSSN